MLYVSVSRILTGGLAHRAIGRERYRAGLMAARLAPDVAARCSQHHHVRWLGMASGFGISAHRAIGRERHRCRIDGGSAGARCLADRAIGREGPALVGQGPLQAVGIADVDPQEIPRVLLNLISNGFYAATKRKVEAGDGFEPILSAATKNLGDKVEIRIRDNGAGIPKDIKEKIFNPFFTTKPSGEGTGLGLSMSHDIIVKQHGGSIDVEREPGLFTEFKIVLPRTSQR